MLSRYLGTQLGAQLGAQLGFGQLSAQFGEQQGVRELQFVEGMAECSVGGLWLLQVVPGAAFAMLPLTELHIYGPSPDDRMHRE